MAPDRSHSDEERELASMPGEAHALEAIERLSAANRVHRDHLVERRLVALRHEAFSELPKTPGRADWPPSYEDPFPARQGVPAVDATSLCGDLLGGAITNHGCLHVRGLLEAASVHRLRDDIQRTFDAREEVSRGAPVESAAPWYVPFEPGLAKAQRFAGDKFVRTVDAPGTLWEIVELFDQQGVTRAVTEYFLERPAMIANKWILRRSPSGVVGSDFHQDGAFLGEGIRTVDCWVALSRCGPGTGRPAVELIPKRFDGVLPSGDGASFPWALSEASLDGVLTEVPLACPVFEEGDALFFDEVLPHRTTQGPELATRYAIESWFVAPSSYPAKHLPIVL